MLPPNLSNAERLAALNRAADVRAARSALYHEVKAGTLSVADILGRPDDDIVVARMRVFTLIESLPGFGKAKARRVMWELGISERRRIQGLGRRQKAQLLDRF